MNPAAAAPINSLTADQAVDELARILDAAPDEADQLACICWKRDNSARAQQLEAHIIHLQKKAAETPAALAEVVNSQDAPPPAVAA